MSERPRPKRTGGTVGPDGQAREGGRRFFYLHVMKTAGGTFSRYLRAWRKAAAVYPSVGLDEDLVRATMDIPYLLGLPPERHRSITVYTGHFPSVVADLVDPDLTTLLLLREPVARAVSYLRHCRLHDPQHRDRPYEEIYEDPETYERFLRDHQVKQLAMTIDDPLRTYFDPIDIDEARYALAVENLERIDVVGTTERFGDFVDEVRARFGWPPLDVEDLHRPEGVEEVPVSLRRRIAADCEADRALYDHARRLVAQQRLGRR